MKQDWKKGIIFLLFFCLGFSFLNPTTIHLAHANPPLQDQIILRMGMAVSPELDPGRAINDTSVALSNHLFRGLTQLNDSGEVLPDLAASWQASEDLQTWTFTLKNDIFWVDDQGHTQARLTAQDAAFTWTRSLQTSFSPLVDLSIIQNCTALDDLTVEYQLTQPYGGFPFLLASIGTFPVPQSLIQSYGNDWDDPDNIWTNGPYYLKSFIPNNSLVMERNPHWPGADEIQIDRVEIALASSQSLSMLFKQGNLDVVWLDEPEAIAAAANDPDLSNQILLTPSLEVYGYAFGPTLLMDSPQLRLAISLTINRPAICKQEFAWANPVGVILPSGVSGHRAIPIQIFDPIQAVSLLQALGYERADQISFSMGYVGGNFNGSINESVRASWEHFGFDLTAADLTWEEMINRNFTQVTNEPPDDVMMWPWRMIAPDPLYYYWDYVYDGWHLTDWQNDAVDDLIASAMMTTSVDERAKYLRQIEEILLWEDPLFMPICGKSHVFLVNPAVFLANNARRIFDLTRSLKDTAYKAAIEKKTGVTLENGDQNWSTREVKLFNEIFDAFKNNLDADLLKNFQALKTIIRKKADGGTFGSYSPATDKITIYNNANSKFDFNHAANQFKGTLAHEILHLLMAYNPKTGKKYRNVYNNPLLKGYIKAINQALDNTTGQKGSYGWYHTELKWHYFTPDETWEEVLEEYKIDPGLDWSTFDELPVMPVGDYKSLQASWSYLPTTHYARTNPEEDLAEAIMFYILKPEWLDSARYDYIKQHIFNGKEFK